MKASDGGPAVTIRRGDYGVAHDDAFFARMVSTGRKCVDARERGKVGSEDEFRAEMKELRTIAPSGGHVLLDELDHRWANPAAPPSVSALTFNVCVDRSFKLLGGGEPLGEKALSTKIGQASRSLAPRIVRYDKSGIVGAILAPRSVVLRLVIYGHGDLMVSESDLKRVAKQNGVPLMRADETGAQRPIGTEIYAGDSIIEPIYDFVRERTS